MFHRTHKEIVGGLLGGGVAQQVEKEKVDTKANHHCSVRGLVGGATAAAHLPPNEVGEVPRRQLVEPNRRRDIGRLLRLRREWAVLRVRKKPNLDTARPS